MLYIFTIDYIDSSGAVKYFTTMARNEKQAIENAEKACNLFSVSLIRKKVLTLKSRFQSSTSSLSPSTQLKRLLPTK